MYQLIFRNWKVAALWAVGLTASVGAFFSDGGGHEQLEHSADQIRESRAQASSSPVTEAAEPEPEPAAPARTAPLPEIGDEAGLESDDAAAPAAEPAEISEGGEEPA